MICPLSVKWHALNEFSADLYPRISSYIKMSKRVHTVSRINNVKLVLSCGVVIDHVASFGVVPFPISFVGTGGRSRAPTVSPYCSSLGTVV